ncbi:hypothetical protein VTO42DRAFT_7768 [Malbranchea cinnamomea]
MPEYSKACCSIPPVVASGYEKKGKFIEVNGLKTYVTGPEDANKAILVVYDIFGFFDQTIQGADILSTSDPEQKYRVFMPDFFEGSPADISWYPPQTEEQKQKLGHFFQTKAPPPDTLSRIPGIVAAANKLHPSGSFSGGWGIVGYCWGGKITSLAAGKDSLFKAAAQCHPAMVDPNDATKVTIPMALLASKDEDEPTIEAYKANLKVPHHVDYYKTQIHGWMAARGDLSDPEVRKQYEHGYKTVLGFFREHLGRTQSKI